MAQFMISEGIAEPWKRQDSAASTTLPSSPPMSRMVSSESDLDCGDRTKAEADYVDFEFDGLPDGVYNAPHPKGGMIFLLVSCCNFVYLMFNSASFSTLTGIVAVLLLVPGLYLRLFDGCSLDHSWPEDFEENVKGGKAACPLGCQVGGKAARPLASQIIDSVYGMCIYMSFFILIGAVAILKPGALLLVPPVYICLIDDRRTEDVEEEDDASEKKSRTSAFSHMSFSLGSFLGAFVYTFVFVLLGVVTIVAILLPASLVFSLQD